LTAGKCHHTVAVLKESNGISNGTTIGRNEWDLPTKNPMDAYEMKNSHFAGTNQWMRMK
jgi:hypothetical protein